MNNENACNRWRCTHTHTHTHTRVFTSEIIARNSDLFVIPKKRNLTYNQEF